MKAAIVVISIIISVILFIVFVMTEKMLSHGDITFFPQEGYKKKSHYAKVRKFLAENGADFMFGTEVNPLLYDLVNAVFGLLFASVGAKVISIWVFPIGFIIGYRILGAILKLSNKKDNKSIMADIKKMYDTLVIKTEAGMFFSESLPECYKSVSNKRLKDALIRMNSEIVIHNDISSAITNLQGKFRSDYIDTFCIIVRQALESGQTLQILNDMSSQLNDIQKAVNEQKKAQLEREVMTVQVLVYAVMIIIIVYYIFSIIGNFALDAL